MTSPVPSTSVVISGAETTAGSMPNRRSSSGRTDATVADQTQHELGPLRRADATGESTRARALA
jgi:hypothetical protein